MAGHSHWAGIKHKKGKADKQRSKIFSKLSKEITVAAKLGDKDPDMNSRLRSAIQAARSANMPKENIKRAIDKSSTNIGENFENMRYEGFGPDKIAVIVEVLTDNKNRTVSEVRSTFTKIGGSMAEAGAVAWQFEQKGVVVVNSNEEQVDELTLVAIDAGADDIETIDTTLHAYSAPSDMEEIRRTLSESGADIESSELAMVPKNTIALDDKTAMQALRLLDQLEELDDIQKVFSNADFPDEALEEYANAE